jgi:hypothetical protein
MAMISFWSSIRATSDPSTTGSAWDFGERIGVLGVFCPDPVDQLAAGHRIGFIPAVEVPRDDVIHGFPFSLSCGARATSILRVRSRHVDYLTDNANSITCQVTAPGEARR